MIKRKGLRSEMDASDPRDAGAAEPRSRLGEDSDAGAREEIGLVSGAAAPLWATILFAGRLRAQEGVEAARGFLCGVGDGAFGRLGAAAFGASPRLEAAGVGFEPVLDAEIAAAAHAGAQKAASRAGAPAFSVFYSAADGLMRGGATALQRARRAGAPGGGLAVVVDDVDGATRAADALRLFGAPTLHPASPSEAIAACLAALAGARAAGDWAAVALPLSVAEAAARHPEAATALDGACAAWPQDRRTHGAADARIGVAALGGGWAALDRAAARLGLDDASMAALGISFFRLMRTEPVDAAALRAYAANLDVLLIVDDGGALTAAAQAALYGAPSAPIIERLPAGDGAFAAEELAAALGRRIAALDSVEPSRAEPLKSAAARLETERGAALDGVGPIGAPSATEAAEWLGAARYAPDGRSLIRLDSRALDAGGEKAIRAAARAGAPCTFVVRWRPAPLWTHPARFEEDALADAPAAADLTAPSRLAARLLAAGVGSLGVLVHPERPVDRRLLPTAARVSRDGDFDRLEAELATDESVAAILDLRAYEGPEALRRPSLAAEADVLALNTAVCSGCEDSTGGGGGVPADKIGPDAGGVRRIDADTAHEAADRLSGACMGFIGASGARPKPLRAPPPPPAPARPALRSGGATIAFSGGKEAVQAARILAAAARREGAPVGLWVAADGARSLGLAALCRLDDGAKSEAALAAPPATGEIDVLIACDARADAPPPALFRDAAALRPANGPSARELGALYFGAEAQTGLIALGAAYQRGALPISGESILDALSAECRTTRARAEAAFDLGRAAGAPDGAALAAPTPARPTLKRRVERNAAALVAYQDASWAERYSDGVAGAARSEKIVAPESSAFAEAVADGLYALMSYRDLYEISRLISDTAQQAAEQAFESLDGGPVRPVIYIPSVLLAGRDDLGKPRKIGFGPWLLPILRLLKRGRALRGGAFDPAGWSRLRRLERGLIRQYEEDLVQLGRGLSPERLPIAVQIARLPRDISGFGETKERAIAVAEIRRLQLWAAFNAAPALGAAGGKS